MAADELSKGAPSRGRPWRLGAIPCILWAAWLSGCAPRIPVPPTGPHQDDVPVRVPYPPPPARVETIPAQPAPTTVWIDGHWRWTAGGYAWQPGRWEAPRPGAHYAPATTVRRRNGELLYYVGSWQGGEPAAAASSEANASLR